MSIGRKVKLLGVGKHFYRKSRLYFDKAVKKKNEIANNSYFFMTLVVVLKNLLIVVKIILDETGNHF